jgi:hypothetical protein
MKLLLEIKMEYHHPAIRRLIKSATYYGQPICDDVRTYTITSPYSDMEIVLVRSDIDELEELMRSCGLGLVRY